jgi:arsenate reductase
MAADPTQRVLFISTGNAVRSIFAEYLLNNNKISKGRFKAFSAGSQPTGTVDPYVIEILREHYKINASRARSKSWDEFRNTQVDMVITVCDRARESCPLFPGQPEIANWNIPIPTMMIDPTWIFSTSLKEWRSRSKPAFSYFARFRLRN